MGRDLQDIPGASDALAYINEVYVSSLRRSGRTTAHPAAVARLLADDGQPADVVIAGLLHDVIEDTDVDVAAIRARFGAQVANLVKAVTQDDGLEDYRRRKVALRRRTVDAGPGAAAVALADKIAKLQEADRRPRRRKLQHYRATLDEVEERFGVTPLSLRLRDVLARWPDDGAPGAA